MTDKQNIIKSSDKNEISISSFFDTEGFISGAIKNFEPRKEQSKMASSVWESLSNQKHLIVEAGTGVGKSLAYLLPAALCSVQNKKKVVIATYTKALQEQLIKKDLPIVQKALSKAGFAFKYSLLMGSSNYMCLRRFYIGRKQEPELFNNDGANDVYDKLLEWSKSANSGLRTKIPFIVPDLVWQEINRDPDRCLGKKCRYKEDCLRQKDIKRANQSDIIIANQHLFFTGIPIHNFSAVIFDEAHNLEEVASNFLGFSLTNWKIKRLLDDICNLKSGRGLIKKLKGRSNIWRASVKDNVSEIHYAAKIFFQEIREKFDFSQTANQSIAKRITEPNFIGDSLSKPFQELNTLLTDALSLSRSDEEEKEIKAHKNRCLEIMEQLSSFRKCEGNNHAYWIEIRKSKRKSFVSINKSPLDVSEELRKNLFNKHCPVILTSATLTVNGSFSMAKSRLGLDNPVETLLDSPFKYESRAVIYNMADIPSPKDQNAYESFLIKRLPNIINKVPGGIFILYTNWRLLEKSSKILTDASINRPILKQGDKSPERLLSEFKRSGKSVLLATDTFWQGIDVPGPALSCVIITKLPFLSPGNPVEEAKHEKMAAKGVNVFNEYVLPKAIIKFRQGFGRLIRHNTDFGAVVILDSRIKTRYYGARFLNSIPKCGRVNSLIELNQFFKKHTDIITNS